jgi:hypothetical protein
MCSGYGLGMALPDGRLDGSDLYRRKNAGKRRVLPQAVVPLTVRLDDPANVLSTLAA